MRNSSRRRQLELSFSLSLFRLKRCVSLYLSLPSFFLTRLLLSPSHEKTGRFHTKLLWKNIKERSPGMGMSSCSRGDGIVVASGSCEGSCFAALRNKPSALLSLFLACSSMLQLALYCCISDDDGYHEYHARCWTAFQSSYSLLIDDENSTRAVYQRLRWFLAGAGYQPNALCSENWTAWRNNSSSSDGSNQPVCCPTWGQVSLYDEGGTATGLQGGENREARIPLIDSEGQIRSRVQHEAVGTASCR